MRTISSLLGLLSLTAPVAAQTIDVTSTERDYQLIATGYDYEFDDGVGASDATTAAGVWEQDVSVDLQDWYGADVSRGRAFHESDVFSTGIVADLSAESETLGSGMFYADAWSETQLVTSFDVNDRVRYSFEVSATTTDAGYAVATVSLSSGSGNLAYVRVWAGDAESESQIGWLQAGSYTLDALAEAVAIDGAELSQTDIQLALRTYHAADFEMDGDVDRRDRGRFKQAYLAGSPLADFDGDGDTDPTDWNLFRLAWRGKQ